MSALRILALSYLLSASVFLVTATAISHPELGRGLAVGVRHLASAVQEGDWNWNGSADRLRAALHDVFNRPPVVRLTLEPEGPLENSGDAPTRIAIAPQAPPVIPAPAPRSLQLDDRFAEPEFSASVSMMILPDLVPEPPPVLEPVQPRLKNPQMPNTVLPRVDVARIPAPPPLDAPLSGRADAARARLQVSLSPEMRQNFELFLYVSKAQRGPLAQRLYVFGKQADGSLALLHDWAASTGRERSEVNARGKGSFTSTPAGYYQFDPARMYRKYHSYSWDQPMPHAMFFNWERQGLQTGLAIHSASGEGLEKLGQRASAGCVHLSPENAQTLYEMVRSQYRGQVPRFAYNAATQTMSNKGAFMHDREGRLKMADGYKALIIIEDFGGDKVAALF